MKNLITVLIACFFLSPFLYGKKLPKVLFIPQPESEGFKKGHFVFTSSTRLFLPAEFINDLGPYFNEKIKNDAGINISVGKWDNSESSNFIRFEKTDDITLSKEGYFLEISPDKIIVKACSYAGIFNAFQTFRQTIPANAKQVPDKAIKIPCLLIKDMPRFEWRGLMLDHARHFQSKEFVMKQIDIISSYKINKFHWHLTDDQGWRVEIKKYPNLTKKGAWRADRIGIAWWNREPAKPSEPTPVGGYYTQKDISEIVEYATIRNVEIIPEIDLPGHSKALKAAYPFLSCRNDLLFEVSTGGKSPNNTICAGRESTYEFIGDVITEIAQIFPSEYIHIGGDECNKSDWMNCPECNKKMKENSLKKFDELQSYFINRISNQVNKQGKTMIGWDEIMEGKGTTGAVIMAWRRNKYTPEIDAPRSGYTTIQASFTNSYISKKQGPAELEPEGPKDILTLSQTYKYEPVPVQLTNKEASRIIGTEVCLWGEFTPTPEHCEYMLYPRVLANAEVGWTNPLLKDWKRFQHAVEENFIRFERDKVNYSKSAYNPFVSYTTDTLRMKADVRIIADSDIHGVFYTDDGSEPTIRSKKYSKPFTTELNSVIKAGIFDQQGNLLGKIVTK